MQEPEAIRTYRISPYSLAIPLPPTIKSQLHRLCFGLPSVKWIDEEHVHLTLLHIGAVEGTLLLDIKEKLSEIIFPPFSLSLNGVGCSHKKSKGLIWVGIHPSEPLLQLYNVLNKILNALPIEKEARSFSPHVALARYEKLNEGKLGDYLETNIAFTTQPFSVNGFVLLSCEKTERHTFFIEHARFPLTGVA